MEQAPQAPAAVSPGSAIFAAGLSAAFLAVVGWVSFHHEFWRDELQAWVIVRDTRNLSEMFQAIRYEGHPPIWYLLLEAAQHFTANPSIMKWLNVGLETAAVVVVAVWAPWSRVAKVLFAFGYFPLYEYGALSRNYSAGLLLGFIAAALLSAKVFRPIWLTLVLLLMGQTNAYAMVISMGLAVAAVVEWHCRRGEAGGTIISRRKMLACTAIFVAGVLLYGIELRQPDDAGVVERWYANWGAFTAFFRAFVPIPNQTLHFWNSNLFDAHPVWQWTASAVVALLATSMVAGRPASLALWIVAVDGLLMFMFVKYLGYLRHQGHLFILFLIADWLSRTTRSWRDSPALPRFFAWPICRPKLREAVFLVLLASQAAVAGFAVWREHNTPFSQARLTAQYIKTTFPGGLPTVGNEDTSASAVCAFFGGEKFYYLPGHVWETYIHYDRHRWATIDMSEAFDIGRLIAAVQPSHRTLVLISLGREVRLPPGEQPIWKSGDAIVADETYELFLVPDIPSAKTP